MLIARNSIISALSALALFGCGATDPQAEDTRVSAQNTVAESVTTNVDLSGIGGVQEMIISVRDLDEAIRTYTTLGDWAVIASGEVDDAAMEQWAAPANMTAKYAVVSNPGHKWGFLRIVQFGDGSAPEIRPGARPFDSGAIFNINSFAVDIDSSFDTMRRFGFVGFAEPSRYTLSMGEYAGAILSGPDGVVVNLLSRLSRGYDEFDPFTKLSNILNATQVVDDFEKSNAFYQDKLGFKVKYELEPKWRESGDNNFSLPNSIAQSGAVKQKAVSLELNENKIGGTIELLTFEGITGRDFSDRAIAPNRGILMYGIHQTDLTAYRDRVAQNGVETIPAIDQPLTEFEIPPYGKVRSFRVRAPEGAILQFFEQIAER